MSYQPYNRNTSGIVFFGEQGSQPTYYSDSNFVIEDGAAGSLRIPNLRIGDGGTIGSASDTDAITIAGNGNVTMSKSLSITGDLTVNGTTTTVESTVVTIEDPIIIIGTDSSSNQYGSSLDDNKDRGISFFWNDGSNPKIGFFGFDDSAGGFTFIRDASFDDASGVVTGAASWATFAGVSGNLVGDVTGNADTATTWASTLTINLGDELSGSTVFDGDEGSVTLNASLTANAITGLTAESSIANDDLIMIYDTSNAGLRKMTKANFVSALGGGTMSTFIINDGTTSQTIDDGETITFADGVGAEFVISATNTVTVNSVDGEIDHDQLLNFVGNEHINHTSVTLTAGEGLTGGGDISASRSFALDFSDLSTTDTAVGATDLVSIHDGAQKKITFANFEGSLSLANLSDYDANDHIDHTTVSITAGAGLSGGGTIAATRTLAIDISEFSTAAVASGDSFLALDSDGATEQRATISALGAYLAGSNITANGAGVLSASHENISAASSVNNSGRTYIQDITLDSNGHVTGLVSATETVTDTTYTAGTGLSLAGTQFNVNLVSATTQSVAANSVSATASRTYAVQVNSSDQLVVNVPWTDVNELTTEEVQDIVGAQIVTNGSHTLISAAYDDAGDGAIDLTVNNDLSQYDNSTSAFITAADLTAGTLIDITSTTINVDLSEAGEAAIANGDYILFLDGGSTGTAAKESLADLATLFAGNGLTASASVLAVNTDGSTLTIASDQVKIADGGVDTTQLAAGAVTEAKRERTVNAYSSSIGITHDVALGNASGGAITLTLPSAAAGKRVTIKKTDSSSNTVTIQRDATNSIDGANTKVLYSQYESMTVISDGTNWFVI